MLLQNMGVDLILLDIEKDAEARREYKMLGGNGVPLIDIEGTYLSGYSESAIRSTVESKR